MAETIPTKHINELIKRRVISLDEEQRFEPTYQVSKRAIDDLWSNRYTGHHKKLG